MQAAGVVPYLPLPELGKKKVTELMKVQKIIITDNYYNSSISFLLYIYCKRS